MEVYHTELNQVENSISDLNKLLSSRESSKESAKHGKAGIELEILEHKERIEHKEKKLEYLKKFRLEATKPDGLLPKLYIWLLTRVNIVAFAKRSELVTIKEKLQLGAHVFPDYVVDYYANQCIEAKDKTLKSEKNLLSQLEKTLKQQEQPAAPAQLLALKVSEGLLKLRTKEEKEISKKLKPKEETVKEPTTTQLLIDILFLLLKLLYSSTELICYIAMIIAHAFYGNLLSLIYPTGVLCYALIVRCRPNGKFWKFMLMYTGIIIILKFLTSLAQQFFLHYLCTEKTKDCPYIKAFQDLQANVFFFYI